MTRTFIATTNLLDLRIAARRLRVTTEWLAAETAAGRLPGLPAAQTFLYDWPTLEAAVLVRARQPSEPTAAHTLEEDNARMRQALEEIAEGDCAYGDDCPESVTSHYQCDFCRAREALKESAPHIQIDAEDDIVSIAQKLKATIRRLERARLFEMWEDR